MVRDCVWQIPILTYRTIKSFVNIILYKLPPHVHEFLKSLDRNLFRFFDNSSTRIAYILASYLDQGEGVKDSVSLHMEESIINNGQY